MPGERTPAPTPARIAPLATLPVFFKLAGKKAVLAGGTEGALWKAELLSAAGAEVLVLAGHQTAAKLFEGLVREPVDGPVTVLPRRWAAADLERAALALADLGDRRERERFTAAARAAGCPVNQIDKPADSDFQFGSIVNRSPVVIGISTDGGAPMLGQSIRARIESVLPLGLARWAAAARAWRPQVMKRFASFRQRRGFWEGFVRRAWDRIEREPASQDLDTLLEQADAHSSTGSVALVGAGPGDPELLTLKAVRALQSATVILYDDLVTPEILELARREAKRIAVGKRARGPSCKQEDINAELVRLARAGETVVRLKGGDPLIFGRATEEIEACREAGIEVTLVPGISAAQGAAAALGFSLTERVVARRLQLLTAAGPKGRLPEDIDFDALADPAATTVLYMPRRTLGELADKAIAAGLDPATPAIAVASATRVDQQDIAAPIGSLPAMLSRLAADAPLLVMIGHATRQTAQSAATERRAA